VSARVLIVEDDKDIRRNVQRLLLSEGFTVDVAEHGGVAISMLQAATDLPSVIVLDLMMPVMDGFQFREEQVKIPRLASIPVVIMTADGHLIEKQTRVGAVAALKKPANVDDILSVVKRICKTP
jgi:CheY-like chemotaxis protein